MSLMDSSNESESLKTTEFILYTCKQSYESLATPTCLTGFLNLHVRTNPLHLYTEVAHSYNLSGMYGGCNAQSLPRELFY